MFIIACFIPIGSLCSVAVSVLVYYWGVVCVVRALKTGVKHIAGFWVAVLLGFCTIPVGKTTYFFPQLAFYSYGGTSSLFPCFSWVFVRLILCVGCSALDHFVSTSKMVRSL